MKKIGFIVIIILLFLFSVFIGYRLSNLFAKENKDINDTTKDNDYSNLTDQNQVEETEELKYDPNFLEIEQEENEDYSLYEVKSCTDEQIDKSLIQAVAYEDKFVLKIAEIESDKIDYKKLLDRENRTSIYDIIAISREYIETSKSKKYNPITDNDGNASYGASNSKIVNYKQTFNVKLIQLTEEITIHLFTNSNNEIILDFELQK